MRPSRRRSRLPGGWPPRLGPWAPRCGRRAPSASTEDTWTVSEGEVRAAIIPASPASIWCPDAVRWGGGRHLRRPATARRPPVLARQTMASTSSRSGSLLRSLLNSTVSDSFGRVGVMRQQFAAKEVTRTQPVMSRDAGFSLAWSGMSGHRARLTPSAARPSRWCSAVCGAPAVRSSAGRVPGMSRRCQGERAAAEAVVDGIERASAGPGAARAGRRHHPVPVPADPGWPAADPAASRRPWRSRSRCVDPLQPGQRSVDDMQRVAAGQSQRHG